MDGISWVASPTMSGLQRWLSKVGAARVGTTEPDPAGTVTFHTGAGIPLGAPNKASDGSSSVLVATTASATSCGRGSSVPVSASGAASA